MWVDGDFTVPVVLAFDLDDDPAAECKPRLSDRSPWTSCKTKVYEGSNVAHAPLAFLQFKEREKLLNGGAHASLDAFLGRQKRPDCPFSSSFQVASYTTAFNPIRSHNNTDPAGDWILRLCFMRDVKPRPTSAAF